MNDIAFDAHSATFTVAVLNQKGRLTRCRRRKTSEHNLIEEVASVVCPRRVVVEEGPLAQWIKTVLEPYVDELIVCDPRKNRWIAEDEFNDDRTSAIKLAQLTRGGYIKPIAHPGHEAGQLRRLFYHYFDLSKQVARFKNKLKATFRQVGEPAEGEGIYAKEARERWLKLLEGHRGLLYQAEHLYGLLEVLEQMKSEALSRTATVARSWDSRTYKVLNTVPGIAKVISTGYMAIIVNPDRFSKENKLWRYAGLANVLHVSDEVVYRERPSKSGNRALKWLVSQHFQGAVVRKIARGKSNRFVRRYLQLRGSGQSEKVAKRTICRALLSVVRAVWRKGEPYREEQRG